MIDLSQFTKEQQFTLVSTALADTWLSLNQDLSDSEVVEFKTSQLSLNLGKLGFQVTVFRPNGLILYTFSLKYIIDNSLVYEVVRYQRNKPVFGKDFQAYYSEDSGFECLWSELPEEYLAPFITGIREVVSRNSKLSNTFEIHLGQLIQGVPSAKQLERRTSEIKANPKKELRGLFLRMSKFYKSFLADSVLSKKRYKRSIRGAAVTLNKIGFYYMLVVSSKELYTFTISTTDEKDQYNYKLTNRKGTLASFTDYGIFYEDADHLSTLIPNKDIMEFIMVFESCFAKLGLGSL